LLEPGIEQPDRIQRVNLMQTAHDQILLRGRSGATSFCLDAGFVRIQRPRLARTAPQSFFRFQDKRTVAEQRVGEWRGRLP
jgi:hypothetical protein